MKFSSILSIGIILLIFTTGYAEAQEGTVAEEMNNAHYLVVGHIYKPYTQDNIVILTNTKTNEKIEIKAINCKHGLKVYLFNLANLQDGWEYTDTIIINYGNQSATFKILTGSMNAQVDIYRPYNWDPILILIGSSLVVLSSGIYFYMKKKKTHNEESIMEELNEIETKGFKLLNDFGVRALIATMVIMGYIGSVGYTIYTGNKDMIPAITSMYMPLVSIVILFYFQASAMKDLKK